MHHLQVETDARKERKEWENFKRLGVLCGEIPVIPPKQKLKGKHKKEKERAGLRCGSQGSAGFSLFSVNRNGQVARTDDQPYRHGDPHPWRNLQLLEEGHHTKLKGRLEHHCAWGRSPSHGGSTDSRCWDAAKQETVIKDEQACFGADTMMGAHAMYSKGCSKRLKQCGGFEGK